MALLTALAFAVSLADGHRIQPNALSARKLHSELPASSGHLSTDPSDVRAPHNQSLLEDPSVGLQQQTTFENLEHSNSMLQQQISTTQLLKQAFDTTEVKIFSSRISLSQLPRPFLGVLVGSILVALVCCGGFTALTLVAYLPRNKTARLQHIHDGRMVYEWDQTSTVATIYITPPEGVKESDLDIRIAAQHLRVGRKGKSSFLREETYDLVNDEMSSWSMRSNGELEISLHKLQRAVWPAVLRHDGKPGGPGFHFVAMNSKFKPTFTLGEQNQEKQAYAP